MKKCVTELTECRSLDYSKNVSYLLRSKPYSSDLKMFKCNNDMANEQNNRQEEMCKGYRITWTQT